jgi:hypothetical protein
MSFRFSIGDIVYYRCGLDQWVRFQSDGVPKAFCVLEQIAQTCPGGTQIHYRIRAGGETAQVLEHEIVASESPEVLNAFQTRVDMERREMERVHRERRDARRATEQGEGMG